MGRKQTSLLKHWNSSKEATDNDTCNVCNSAWSNKRSVVSPRDVEVKKRAFQPRKLAKLKLIVLPKGAVDGLAISAGSRYVTPVLEGDTITKIEEEASKFPLPFPPDRVLYIDWIKEMYVCAPCYYRMRRNLESIGIMTESRMPWVKAYVIRRGQLIDEGIIPPDDRRGFVDRRDGPMDRRMAQRRFFNPRNPAEVKTFMIRRLVDDTDDEV